MSQESEKEAQEALEIAMMKMPPEAARRIDEYVKALVHYRDSTVGLWVTDKPKSVDEKKLMWQLKF